MQESVVIRNRDGEKGAAMVMALMITFLLLVASAGLIMESSMNTQNVTDATAEQQALAEALVERSGGGTIASFAGTIATFSAAQSFTTSATSPVVAGRTIASAVPR